LIEQFLEKHLVKGLLRVAILYVIGKTSMYGYQIYKLIKKCVYDKISLSTLYTILKELEKLGLIYRVGLKYHISEKGVEVFKKIMEKYPFIIIFLTNKLDFYLLNR